jgi:hypothetical protein
MSYWSGFCIGLSVTIIIQQANTDEKNKPSICSHMCIALAMLVMAGEAFVLTDIVLARLAENLKSPSLLELNLKSTAKLYLSSAKKLVEEQSW